MLVPLVLLQALQSEGVELASLLALGVRYLEEAEADYIIQQGGWVSSPCTAPHHTGKRITLLGGMGDWFNSL